MKTYKDLQELQTKLNLHYKGIDLSKVLVFELWHIVNQKPLWHRIGDLNFCRSLNINKINHTEDVLTTFGRQNRKDHKEVYDFVYNTIEDKASYNDLNTFRDVYSCNLLLWFKIFIDIFRKLRLSHIRFVEKLKLASVCCRYCNTIEELDKSDFRNIKIYIAMYSFAEDECLLTQYFKQRGVETYALCEGVYIRQMINPGIDACTYLNFTADKMLVWGEYSVDEMVKAGLDARRILPCGYPHPIEKTQMREDFRIERCMVLLARKNVESSNLRLLDILSKSESKCKYCLKLHPTLDYAQYTQIADDYGMEIIPKDQTISECLDNNKFDLCIAVNTSAYYESLIKGVPCLRYKDKSFALMYGLEDSFENISEYDKLYHQFLTESREGYQKLVDNMLKYVLGVGINKYNVTILS